MYYAGDEVQITTGSAKTHNLRTLRGTVVRAVDVPIEGTNRAFRMFEVRTAEGIVTEAASRIVPAVADETAAHRPVVRFTTRAVHGHLNYGSYHVIVDGWAIGRVRRHFTYGWEFTSDSGHAYGRTRLDAVNAFLAQHAAHVAAQDEMIRQGAETDATVERYGTANPTGIGDGLDGLRELLTF